MPDRVRQRNIVVILVVALVVVLAVSLGLRRWVRHAELELFPVVVPTGAVAADVVNPPPAAIARRMAFDVRDALSPPKRPRYAVLSFDDGPYPVTTPVLLAELSRLGVPADFFLIGRDADVQPAIAARVAGAMIEVGGHTQNHLELVGLAYQTQLAEIMNGAQTIARVTGRKVTYFRPPHGRFDANTLQAAAAAGATTVFWDVDPGDWKQVTPEFIVANVTAHAKSPAVMLLHNGSAATIAALPGIVAAYKRAGFEFVTLSQLQRDLPIDQINDPLNVNVSI